MTQRTQIEDDQGNIITSMRDSGHQYVHTASVPAYTWISTIRPFINSAGSNALNIDASVGGTPDGVHDGTDTALWTASALSGTWTFNSAFTGAGWPANGTQSVDATATVNGDQALFTRSSPINTDNYSSLSGGTYLTTYNVGGGGLNNQILIFFRLAGAQVGVSQNLGDYIDTSSLNTGQSWNIPLSAFNVTGNVDEVVVQTVRAAGQPPSYYLDVLQFEETGGETFVVAPEKGTYLGFKELSFIVVDNISTTLADNSMTNLAYNQILSIPALTNGIILRGVAFGEVQASFSIRQLADFYDIGLQIVDSFSDGTNTCLKISLTYPEYAILDSRKGDRLELFISEDLSGLIKFSSFVIGRRRIL